MTHLFGNRSFSVLFFEDYQKDYDEEFGSMERFRKGHYFYLKVMAMMCTKFQNVIFVDDDAFLLRDPLFLLNTRQFQETGALFWHDMYGIHPENLIWQILELEKRTGLAGESGMVVLNKAIAWKGLYFVAYMNNKQNVFYRMVWGDKDTFFLGFDYMKQNYTFMPYAPNTIGNSRYYFSFVQAGPDGIPLFIHLVSGKRYFMRSRRNQLSRVLLYDPNTCYLHVDTYYSFTVRKDKGCVTQSESYKKVVGNVPMYITRSYWNAVDELNAIGN